MRDERNNNESKFMRYIRRTWKQKICALALILIGIVSAIVSGGEANALIFLGFIGVPLFFAGTNYLDL